MSNVCELPHEHATACTMHVSIAVSSDRGMCKHVVRRGAGAITGTMMIEIEAGFFFRQVYQPSQPSEDDEQRERERETTAKYQFHWLQL